MKSVQRNARRSIEMIMPGLGIVRTYQRRWLWADLFAGMTIFAMLVPQGMAYGELAGVAPVVGLRGAGHMDFAGGHGYKNAQQLIERGRHWHKLFDYDDRHHSAPLNAQNKTSYE